MADFEVNKGILHLPAVEVPNSNGGIDIYQAELVLWPDSQPLTLELNINSVKRLDKVESLSHTQFDPSTGIVQIPVVEIPEVSTGELKTYRAELQLVPGSSPMRFTVKLLENKPR